MRKNNNYHKNGWHHIEKWLKKAVKWTYKKIIKNLKIFLNTY